MTVDNLSWYNKGIMKEFIQTHLLDKQGRLNSNLLRDGVLGQKYPQQYENLMKMYPEYTDIRQKIYAVLRGDYYRCPECGSVCDYDYTKSQTYCSRECARQVKSRKISASRTPDVMRKIVQKAQKTTRQKYGVDNPMQSSDVRQKMQTTMEQRYGCSTPLSNEDIKQKMQAKMQERYGATSFTQTEDWKRKTEATNLTKYGEKYRLQSESEKDKHRAKMQERYGASAAMCSSTLKERQAISKWARIIDVSDCHTMIDVKRKYLKMLGIETDRDLSNISIGSPSYPRSKEVLEMYLGIVSVDLNTLKDNITNYWPYAHELGIELKKSIKASAAETELAEWLSEYADIELRNRSIIAPQELDIFIPSYNIAIEFNGVYWHSSRFVNMNYHATKTAKCLDEGIQLIHVWSNDWDNKKPIVKSVILSKLGFTNKLMARKCNIIMVKSEDAKPFYDANHLKGYRAAKYHVGLEYNGELVMCMSFSCHKKYEWELIRMATKLETTVVGGMSKILTHFLKLSDASTIMSYVDRDISNGKSYAAVGFESIGDTGPSYWYVDVTGNTIPRQQLQKSVRLNDGFYGSEDEYANQLGLFKISNSGNLIYLYRRS